MVDLAKGVAIRNYGLKRTPDSKSVRDSLMLFLPVVIIAGALSFQIWIRSQTIHIGYQTQDLQVQREELQRSRQQLVVEEQMLKNPKWLDEVAGRDLDMIVVRPDQLIPAPVRNWDADNSKHTLMGNLVRPYGSRKASAFD